MFRILSFSIIFLFSFGLELRAWQLPYPKPSGKYTQQADWSQELSDTWAGFKNRYIEAYSGNSAIYGLVVDPFTSQIKSRSIGYGLLMAVLMNDQSTFDKIYDKANSVMWKADTNDPEVFMYHHKFNLNGEALNDSNDSSETSIKSVTDADEDICLALIFADKLVQTGTLGWTAHATPTYADRAQSLINHIYDSEVYDSKYLRVSYYWGGGGDSNNEPMKPGYFSPAWYRIFDRYETTDHDWATVIDQCYTTLKENDGYSKGLAPEWCTSTGATFTGQSYNMDSAAMSVPWRIALDAIWYSDPQAIEYCNNAMTFFADSTDTSHNYKIGYDMSGGTTGTYKNELSVGAWAAGSIGSTNSDQRGKINGEMMGLSSQTSQEKWWGYSGDADAKNRSYNQSLAWFGAAILDGSFANVYADWFDGSLPVELETFVATQNEEGILLTWTTASEFENAGFYVHRRSSEKDEFVPLNPRLIDGHGTDATRNSYKFFDGTVQSGRRYWYRIEDVNFTGEVNQSEQVEVFFDLPVKELPVIQSQFRFALHQNFPNPFNPETWIPFELAIDSAVTVTIFDRDGTIVRKLHFGNRTAGIHRDRETAIYWDGKNGNGETSPSGIYFYQLDADRFSALRKMVLLK